ncbi:hypothetical protein NNJEOMEG_03300 [Fundidesulfovibrio magnetotacticus]|uniref:Uncharacterized protein n=1 Tax=Fundidesulfovibrio magnetotacticus TaxID=2730080 RepID=A0A6V8M0Q4_9BACT|nr:hypothetical protein [Fundidesulfovibrio magnetotacticus]GFK95437.1 hypothetical protein NNJEOMEG_03300 [Fundidesulfovibrio magnetotacticus]
MGVKATTWRQTIQGGKQLFRLYPSRGNQTLTGTVTLPSTLNGPIQVTPFDTLTLNGATVTVENPCRGHILYCKNLIVTGAAAIIHMNGKGCTGIDWENYDLDIPAAIALASLTSNARTLLQRFLRAGWYLGDPQLWKDHAGVVQAVLTAGANKIIDKTLLGAGGYFAALSGWYSGCMGGAAGAAGTGGPGGGGAGSAYCGINYVQWGGIGGKGRPWRGGFGGQGGPSCQSQGLSGDQNRQGSPGGVLVVVVENDVTVGPGLTIAANALPVTGGTNETGGCGGGRAKLLYGGALTGTPTITANGAAGQSGNCSPAAGGAGKADSSTFTAWGL